MKTLRLTSIIKKNIDLLISDFNEEITKLNMKISVLEKFAGVTYNEIEAGIKVLSKREGIKSTDLQYCGISEDTRLLHFTIILKTHPKYGSTITWFSK